MEDLDYYMNEGCGIYAMAIARKYPNAEIYILSRDNGEEWSDSIPYEVTHVYCHVPGVGDFDAKGNRSPEQMAADFDMVGACNIKGPFTPQEFYSRFMGNSDSKPLYGTKKDVSFVKVKVKEAGLEYQAIPKSRVQTTSIPTLEQFIQHYHGLDSLSSDYDVDESKLYPTLRRKYAEFIRHPIPTVVYRQVNLNSIEELNLEEVGIHWTWLDLSEGTFWNDGEIKDDNAWILKGRISSNDIDWYETMWNRFYPSLGESEQEITLKKGIRIPIVAVKKSEAKKWTPFNKLVTANGNDHAFEYERHGAQNQKGTIPEINSYIAVDLDGTLAKELPEFDPLVIGSPIPSMIEKVKEALAKGENVIVFTARLADKVLHDKIQKVIAAWTKRHVGVPLPSTNEKTPQMREYWDDKARGVEKNEGEFKTASIVSKTAIESIEAPKFLAYQSLKKDWKDTPTHPIELGRMKTYTVYGKNHTTNAAIIGIYDPVNKVFAGFSSFNKDKNSYLVAELGVHPKYQGLSLGSKLYAWLIINEVYPILVSGVSQTKGGRYTWEQLAKMPGILVYGWDNKKRKAFSIDPDDIGSDSVWSGEDSDYIDSLEHEGWNLYNNKNTTKEEEKRSREAYIEADKLQEQADYTANNIVLVAIKDRNKKSASEKTGAWTAYVLTEEARQFLLNTFPPKFPDVICHHVTYQFGVSKDASLPPEATIVVEGYASDDSLEALVCSVNGETTRDDGSTYHITLSLDRSQGRKPMDSNAVIKKEGWTPIQNPFDVQISREKFASQSSRESEHSEWDGFNVTYPTSVERESYASMYNGYENAKIVYSKKIIESISILQWNQTGDISDPEFRSEAEELAREILATHQFHAVAIDQDYFIIDGHHRVMAAEILGFKTVPCVCITLEERGDNGDGKTAATDETQSKALADWFRGSKIVDANGRPLRVYHGTNQNFDVFDDERRGDSTHNSPATMGFWFSDHPTVASEYADHSAKQVIHNVGQHEKKYEQLSKELEKAERRKDWDTYDRLTIELENHEIGAIREEPKGANVMPCYLRMVNPKVVEVNGLFLNLPTSVAEILQTAKSEGRDGVIFKNVDDSPSSRTLSDHYVVFSANQIKSAIGNNGQYDSTNRSITAATEFNIDDVKVRQGEGDYSYTWFAFWKGKKIGWAAINPFKEKEHNENERCIFKSFVKEGYRRKGVATKLYDAIDDYCKVQGWNLVPTPQRALSDDAFAFWKNRNPESLKSDSRTWNTPYIGKELQFKGQTVRLQSLGEKGGVAEYLVPQKSTTSWGDEVTHTTTWVPASVVFEQLGTPEMIKRKTSKKAALALPTFDQWLTHVGGIKGAEQQWGGGYNDIVAHGVKLPEVSGKSEAEAEEVVLNWIREYRYPHVVNELNKLQFPLTIHRALYLRDRNHLRPHELGIFWTTDSGQAEAYWAEEIGGERQDANTFFETKVMPDQIDWIATLTARMHYLSGDDESEITLRKGTVLPEVRAWGLSTNLLKNVVASTAKKLAWQEIVFTEPNKGDLVGGILEDIDDLRHWGIQHGVSSSKYLKYLRGKKVAVIDDFTVYDKGKGYGTTLLNNFINRAKAADCDAVILEAGIHQLQQKGFNLLEWYKRHGFSVLVPAKAGDLPLMVKWIKKNKTSSAESGVYGIDWTKPNSTSTWNLEKFLSSKHGDDYHLWEDLATSRYETNLKNGSIPIHWIALDDVIDQARFEKSDTETGVQHVIKIEKLMSKGVPLPPALLDDGELIDGNHRVFAADNLHLKLVPVVFLEDIVNGGESVAKREEAESEQASNRHAEYTKQFFEKWDEGSPCSECGGTGFDKFDETTDKWHRCEKCEGTGYTRRSKQASYKSPHENLMDRMEEFFDDYVAHTSPNPDNEKEQIWNNAVAIDLDFKVNRFRIESLHSLNEGEGNASRALEFLKGLADNHGVELELYAVPYGNYPYRVNQAQLKEWYMRHGFTKTPEGSLVYVPPTIEKTASALKPVSIDSLPREVKGDIAYILHDSVDYLRRAWDEDDVFNNLFGLADEPTVLIGKLPVADVYRGFKRTPSDLAVEKYAKMLEQDPNFEFDPILVVNGRFFEGGHRMEAYHRAGRILIPVVEIGNLVNASPENWEKWMNGENVTAAQVFPISGHKEATSFSPLYHGTHGKFEVFRTRRRPGNAMLSHSMGAYFTDNLEVAKRFAGKNGEVKKVTLKLNNPFDLRSLNNDYTKLPEIMPWLPEQAKRFCQFTHAGMYQVLESLDKEYNLVPKLKRRGYDGLIFHDPIEGDTFVAFRPDQIKTAGAMPTRSFKQLWHVGEMDISKKRHGSHEGNGLSVSTYPDAWEQINEFTSGSHWELTKPGNKFLDFHKMTKEQRRQLYAWGVEQGYIEPTELWRCYHTDEDGEYQGYFEFDTLEQALQEAGVNTLDEAKQEGTRIQKDKKGYKPTDRLNARMGEKVEQAFVLDFLAVVYSEDVLHLDGVWWNDRLSVVALSAPRGVIFNSMLSTWQKKKRESYKTAVAYSNVEKKASFDSWFTGSKVVNEDGTPKKVYHGTGADFDVFSHEYAQYQGFYFSDNPATASGYASEGKQPRVLPVYLAIKNPIYLDGRLSTGQIKGKVLSDRQIRAIIMASPMLDNALSNIGDVKYEGRDKVINEAVKIYSGTELKPISCPLANDFYAGEMEAFNNKVRELTGHDGYITNYGEDTTYIAWFPNQIKSALGNSGRFDKKNPSITAATVYHGTPSEFSEFNTDFVGSGEGNQTYGWGLYFAGNKKTAENYRATLAGEERVWELDGKPVDFKSLNYSEQLAFRINGQPALYGKALKTLEDQDVPKATINEVATLAKKYKGRVSYKEIPKGYIYEADIPDDGYLMWNKPLSQQSPRVKEALTNAIKSSQAKTGFSDRYVEDVFFGNQTHAGQIFEDMWAWFGKKEASQYLHSLGIKGVKYLDAGSRNAGDGTYNYVVFDSRDVKNTRTVKIASKMIRLYRGLEQPFNADFDLTKTDAPNGYSTWTDNPELAKQYAGENGYVYQIDLPKSRLGMDLVDEEGERPLFVRTGKKVGLNGVSGNEYLVYHGHDYYNPSLVKAKNASLELPDWITGLKTKNGVQVVYTRNVYGEWFAITINKTPNPSYIALFKDGKIVGGMYTDESNRNGKLYTKIKGIEIPKALRGMGFGKEMYKALLANINTEGIISYLPDRVNKKQIPRIYKSLGGTVDGDWAFIPKTAAPYENAYQQSKHEYSGRWNEEETPEQSRQRYQKQNEWEQSLLAAISLGKLDPKDADTRKDLATSIGGRLADAFKPLPQVLYHVTTAKSKVESQGLQSRFELQMQNGVGLGGGDDKSISFTTDKKVGMEIYSAMIEAKRVAAGEFTVQQMMDMAEKGVGATRPYITEFVRWAGAYRAHSEWSPGQPLPADMQAILEGKKVVSGNFLDAKTLDELKAEGLEPVGEGWRSGRGQVWATWKKPMTEQEKQEVDFDQYKVFCAVREHAGGAMNPLFFSSDVETLARVPESEIALLQFKPIPGAMGTQQSALGEWRTYTGAAVQFVREISS